VVLELDAGVLGGEPPVDTTTGAVARRLPRRDLLIDEGYARVEGALRAAEQELT
jgi:hypothetical protein